VLDAMSIELRSPSDARGRRSATVLIMGLVLWMAVTLPVAMLIGHCSPGEER
jgi:hypothetical protein